MRVKKREKGSNLVPGVRQCKASLSREHRMGLLLTSGGQCEGNGYVG
jgi:hypothetical protein